MSRNPTRLHHWGWTALDDLEEFFFTERNGRIVVMHRHKGDGFCLWQRENQIVTSRTPLSLDNIIQTPCELTGYIKEGRWHDAASNAKEAKK